MDKEEKSNDLKKKTQKNNWEQGRAISPKNLI